MISNYNSKKEKGTSFFKSAIVTLIFHFSLFTFHSFAQVSSTLSSYSRFGLGLLHDQSQGFNKSMGGVGLGVRIGNRINTINPASYSAIDSLSLIFDVGMNASFGQMKQGTASVNVRNASFDYVHVGMRLARKLGLAAGFMPYTNIGYDYTSPDKAVANDALTTQAITNSNTYSGSGGLNRAYVGVGWKVYRDLSIGANVSFLWGNYDHLVVPLYKEGGVSSDYYDGTLKTYTASLKTYMIDLGAQYPVRLTKHDWLNIGATFGIGHKIAQDATLLLVDTLFTASSPFDLPFTFGIGGAWQHKNTLLVAADLHQEFWSNCRVPADAKIDGEFRYVSQKGFYSNRTKVAAGVQWTPDPFDKRYWKRIQYRAGVNYSTPFLKVDDNSGPREISLTVGAGLPIMNNINNRSVINFGLQWLRRSSSAANSITEDYLLINVGVTFNERWFQKYKIE
jgi:hypothetical protein